MAGEAHAQRSLAGYSPWGHKESDTTEHTHTHTPRSRGLCAGGRCGVRLSWVQVHAGASGVMGRSVVKGPWGAAAQVCGLNIAHFPGRF